MHPSGPRILLGAWLTFGVSPVLAALAGGVRGDVPAPFSISPGEIERAAPVRDGCPAFSWSAVPGSVAYEIAVYELDAAGELPPDTTEPALRSRLPAGLSWTPAFDRCLAPGRYAFVARALTARGWSAWSEPRIFVVPDVPPGPQPRKAPVSGEGIAGSTGVEIRDGALAPASLASRGATPERVAAGAVSAPEPCQAGSEIFADVPASSPYCGWIEQLYRDGITAGCGDGNYCPLGAVTRAQMAAFLERVLQARSPRQLDAGSSHNCVVLASGRLTCWGYNSFGQSSPPQGIFRSVSAGHYHSCGVRDDGTVACWGSNGAAESTPPAWVFQSVSAGESHSCGVSMFGFANCWGSNAYGQSSPPGSLLVSVSAGGGHSCGVTTDASVVCWGWNILGQSTPPAETFQSVSAGLVHSCGVKSDATVACWGDDSGGQSTPPAGTFRSVSAGGYHTCGVKSDGTLACWGRGEDGQSMPPAGTFVSVSAGHAHTCGVRGDGTVACWGTNSYGESNPPGWL